jgi:hypothetical protein
MATGWTRLEILSNYMFSRKRILAEQLPERRYFENPIGGIDKSGR